MKPLQPALLLLTLAVFTLSGCATSRVATTEAAMRWAVVDRSRLTMLTHEWTQRRVQEEEAKEVIPDELKEALARYETAQSELSRFTAELNRVRFGPGRPAGVPLPVPQDPASDPGYQRLMEDLRKAREPIAEILDRRARRTQSLQYPLEDLIREYVGDRFDLVIDQSAVNYQVLFRRSK